MTRRIQLRRDTATNWENVDPVLAAGEVGVDLDTMKIKVGNGADSWTELDYYGPVDISDLTDDEGLLGQGGADIGDLIIQGKTISVPPGSDFLLFETRGGDGNNNLADVSLSPNAARVNIETFDNSAGRFSSIEVDSDITVTADLGNVIIKTDKAGDTNTWTFGLDGSLSLPGNATTTGDITANAFIGDGSQLTGVTAEANTGDITFDGTTISTANDEQRIRVETRDGEGDWNTRITMDPDDAIIRLAARRDADRFFGTSSWGTATWINDGGGNRIEFTAATELIEFLASTQWQDGDTRQVRINGGERFDFTSRTVNDDELTLNISNGPTEPEAVSTVEFFWINTSRIELDKDDRRITIEGRGGVEMLVDVDDDITVRSRDDLSLRADDRFDIRSGRRFRIRAESAEEGVVIITDNNDTKQTWEFGADGVTYLPGNGDYTISESEPGLVLSSNFGVAIVTDAAEAGKAFIFGTDGELVLPTGGVIVESEIDGNKTVDIVPGDPVSEDQRLIVKGGFEPGQEPHIHLTMGNLQEGSIFLGTDEHNVRTMTNGGMSISAYDYGGEISKTWEFGTDGNLTLPGATIQSTNTATDTGSAVALDITKSVHKLADGDYTLADGAEGQIIYLVPQTGATNEGVELFIANARVVTNTHSQIVNDNLFLPFSSSTTGSLTNVVTLIFTDGAWNLSGGEWD